MGQKKEIIIAQDAAYTDLYFGKPTPSIFEVPGARDIAVEFYSASKTYCMAGWRAGWVVGNSKLVCALNALKENIDSGQFNAVQNAAAFALRHHDRIVPGVREVFRKRARFFAEGLRAGGWRFADPKGGCFIWAKPPMNLGSEAAVYYMLDKVSVLAAPGAGFGKFGEGYIRFSLTEPELVLKKALNRIRSVDWNRCAKKSAK